MARRGDAPLIKHLATTWGMPTAQAWQHLPYLLLPGGGFDEHLHEQADRLIAQTPTLEHLPWYDCVLDCGRLVRDSLFPTTSPSAAVQDLAMVWARLATRDRFLAERRQTDPWWNSGLPAAFADMGAAPYMVLELWDGVALHLAASMPVTILIPVHDPWGATHTCLLPDVVALGHPLARPQSRVLRECVLLALAYLTQSSEYLVEVTPQTTERERRAAAKTARKRPWLLADRPHYILLDPLRAHEYGCRSPLAGSQPPGEDGVCRGTPRPHGRRGHYRHLRAERFKEKKTIWVAPAWIGPREWQSEGQRYRVLAPAAEAMTPRTAAMPKYGAARG